MWNWMKSGLWKMRSHEWYKIVHGKIVSEMRQFFMIEQNVQKYLSQNSNSRAY